MAKELAALTAMAGMVENRLPMLSRLRRFLSGGVVIGANGFLEWRCAACDMTESGCGWEMRQAGESSIT
mgnify:CR=1 FL=1